MRNLGSKLFVLAIAAVIVAGLVYAFLPQPVEVDLVKVERGTVRVTVDQEGKTRIHDKYVVSAPLSGRILRIEMRPGDPVEAGKTLLTMIEPRDPELLDARSIAQAEARVKAAEATLRQVEPELEKARAGQAFAESELARMRKAFQGKGVTQSDVENAEMIDRQRSEELRSAKMSEEIARFELEQARAALMRSRPRPETVHDAERATRQGIHHIAIQGPISPAMEIHMRIASIATRIPATTTAGTFQFTLQSMAACCVCFKKAPPWLRLARRSLNWAIRRTWRSRSTSFRAML